MDMDMMHTVLQIIALRIVVLTMLVDISLGGIVSMCVFHHYLAHQQVQAVVAVVAQ
jgi:hypothetical protein